MDGDYSHKIKSLLPGRKAITKLDGTVQSRGIILLTKFNVVKDIVFPVVVYGCEGWTIKRAEC